MSTRKLLVNNPQEKTLDNFKEEGNVEDGIDSFQFDADEVNSGTYLDEEYLKEENGVITTKTSDDSETEFYHCSACNMEFTAVMEHIKKFHKHHSVLIENQNNDLDTDNEESDTIIKQETVDEETSEESDSFQETIFEIEIADQPKMELISEEEENLDGIDIDNSQVLEGTDGEAERTKNPFNPTIEDIRRGSDEYKSRYFTHRTQKPPPRNPRKKSKYRRVEKDLNLVCEFCNTVFQTNKSLKLHLRMHGPVKLKPIEDVLQHELKSCTKDGESNQTFFCDLCNKTYDITFQEIHQNSHENNPLFDCQICNHKFPDEKSLEMHLSAHKDHHVKLRKSMNAKGTATTYPCSYCGREFNRPHEKVKHERIHTGEKPYKCEVCGKTFRVSYCLRIHQRTHTDARPYVCPQCNKRFKSHAVLSHHVRTHSEDRPFKCTYCPKSFKTSVQWNGHKKCHEKPFSCPECNRPFGSLYSVRAHMEIHKRDSSSLKHRCTICGAIYARKFALRDHMLDQHQTPKDLSDSKETIVKPTGDDVVNQLCITTDTNSSLGEKISTEEIITDWII